MSVEVTRISKTFKREKALDNISFTLRKGEILGFLGPNGAGKTTLMRIMCGIIAADSGTVLINGMNIISDSLKVRRSIGYLPESNPLYPDMYVREYLRYVAGLYNLPDPGARTEEIIGKTGLGSEKKKKIGQLSKGYRQRVGLAQALIHDPEVLILDEPTSGLDPNQLRQVRELISETGKNKTIMLSTHIMQEVEAVCDRVIIINRGKIAANDSIGNLLTGTTMEQVFRDLTSP